MKLHGDTIVDDKSHNLVKQDNITLGNMYFCLTTVRIMFMQTRRPRDQWVLTKVVLTVQNPGNYYC